MLNGTPDGPTSSSSDGFRRRPKSQDSEHMTRQYRVASTALLFLAVSITASAQRGGGAPAAPPLVRENATEKITEHVYVIPDNNVGMVPNIGIIVGTRGTFVVDTGLGNRNGQTVTREIQKVSKTPELYLATTHFHPEHDLGANGFPTHTKMIRTQDQQKEIAEQGLATADRFRGFSPANAELLQGAEFRKADVSFDREHTRSGEHTSELQSQSNLVCRLLLEKKKTQRSTI